MGDPNDIRSDALSLCVSTKVNRGNLGGYDGFLADYWSMGVILYVMMVAAPPISGNQNSQDLMRMSATKSLLWYVPIPLLSVSVCVRSGNTLRMQGLFVSFSATSHEHEQVR